MGDGMLLPNDNVRQHCWLHKAGTYDTQHRVRLTYQGEIYWLVCCNSCDEKLPRHDQNGLKFTAALSKSRVGGYSRLVAPPRFAKPDSAVKLPAQPVPIAADRPTLTDVLAEISSLID